MGTTVDDVIPDDLEMKGADYHFIFIIDRSTSMQGRNIEMAREALQMFVRSLPSNL